MARRLTLTIDGEFKYGEAIINLLRTEAQGMPLDQMRRRISIIEKVERAGDLGYIILEDAEWSELHEKLQTHRWPVAAQEILTFVEAVEKAERCNLGPADAG